MYHQTLFLISLNKNSQGEESPKFGAKPWTRPFGKFNFFTLLIFCSLELLLLYRSFSSFLMLMFWNRKDMFISRMSPSTFFIIWRKKTQVKEISIFIKAWTNPFGEIQILHISDFSVFVKYLFSYQEYHQTLFLINLNQKSQGKKLKLFVKVEMTWFERIWFT